jgi:uncharacterized protein (TIGR03437 family)
MEPRPRGNPFTREQYPGSDVIAINEDGTTNSADHPAPRGSVVTLFVSGIGQTNPPLLDGQIAAGAAPSLAGIKVEFWYSPNGSGTFRAGTTLYQGAAPGEVAGVYQLNVRIPDDALTGHVPVRFHSEVETVTVRIWLQ